MHHFSYGLVNLPSGRMKSREGTVVDADDIMDEMSNLAAEEIKKRHPDLLDKEVKARAEVIGLGAIKFHMLKMDSAKDLVFDPKESISFEGETAPYIQYTHVRACSILRKARRENHEITSPVSFEALNLAEELAVIRILYSFPEVIAKSAEFYKPHHLAQHLIA